MMFKAGDILKLKYPMAKYKIDLTLRWRVLNTDETCMRIEVVDCCDPAYRELYVIL